MYEKTYGSKYVNGLWDVAVIAKKIREDIKVARLAGCLPDCKISVRSRKFSGGSAIDIEVMSGDFTPYSAEFIAAYKADPNGECRRWHADRIYSRTWLAVKETLRRIHFSYNYDGSEVMVDYFDVNYYGGVGFNWQWGDSFLK